VQNREKYLRLPNEKLINSYSQPHARVFFGVSRAQNNYMYGSEDLPQTAKHS